MGKVVKNFLHLRKLKMRKLVIGILNNFGVWQQGFKKREYFLE